MKGSLLRSFPTRWLKQVFPEGSAGRRVLRQLRSAYSSGRFVPGKRRRLWLARQGAWNDLERFEHAARDKGVPGVVAIFSSTTLTESEGQRSTNIALELARRGFAVLFLYWRWRPDRWAPQDRMQADILQMPLDLVSDAPDLLFRKFEGMQRVALIEFPHPSFFAALAVANAAGWLTVYEAVDDWEEFQRVGQADWFDPHFERHIALAADAVFATHERLRQRINGFGRQEVVLNPNGLAPEVALVDQPREAPRGSITIGYFGYLAQAWFDWPLIVDLARLEPDWRIHLIGYGADPSGLGTPANVILMGKRERKELASLASHWDVAIVPFKPDRLAASADPIKVYEYLAMGLPVVVTGVEPPVGGEKFVERAEGLEAFRSAIRRAAGVGRVDASARRAYAASCTWARRVDQLLAALASDGRRLALKRALFQARS